MACRLPPSALSVHAGAGPRRPQLNKEEPGERRGLSTASRTGIDRADLSGAGSETGQHGGLHLRPGQAGLVAAAWERELSPPRALGAGREGDSGRGPPAPAPRPPGALQDKGDPGVTFWRRGIRGPRASFPSASVPPPACSHPCHRTVHYLIRSR